MYLENTNFLVLRLILGQKSPKIANVIYERPLIAYLTSQGGIQNPHKLDFELFCTPFPLLDHLCT